MTRPTAGEEIVLADLDGERLQAIVALWKRRGGEIVARFGGGSMRPTIEPGREVILRFGEEAEVADVIAYLAEGRLLVHRVVATSRTQDWILTRGDAQVIPDPPLVDRHRIVGVVLGVRTPDGFAPPAPPAGSLCARVSLALCVTTLRLGYRPGRLLIGTLVLLRRWLVAIPRGLGARFGRRVRPYLLGGRKRPTAS